MTFIDLTYVKMNEILLFSVVDNDRKEKCKMWIVGKCYIQCFASLII